MFSFSLPCRRCHDAVTKSHYHDEKKTPKFAKFLQPFESCFGYGPIEGDVPSRNDYQRAGESATGFGKEEIHGIEAEYLDEHDMAWGQHKKSKKQVQWNY